MRALFLLPLAALLFSACGSESKPSGLIGEARMQGDGACPQFELRNAVCEDSESNAFTLSSISLKNNVLQITREEGTHTQTFPSSVTDENGKVSEEFCDSGKVVMVDSFQGHSTRTEFSYSGGVITSKGQGMAIECTQTNGQPKECKYAGSYDYTITCKGQ